MKKLAIGCGVEVLLQSGTGQASSKDARGQCWARVLWSV